MNYDLINNVQSCYIDIPQLLYYSHIPTMFVALLLGIIVFVKNRTLISKILLGISVVYVAWISLSLVSWISVDSFKLMFAWSLFGILYIMLFSLCFYFLYVFIKKKDVSWISKIIIFFMMLPAFIFAATKYNVNSFNSGDCVILPESGYSIYLHSFGLIIFVSMIIFSLFSYIKEKDKNNRKQIILVGLGLLFFIFSFFTTEFLAEKMMDWGIVSNFSFEFNGLFGMAIFMAFLAYLIVKFKAFDIKLIATQVLVWSVVILVGSQFFFIQNPVNKILNSITFLISSVLGFIIVRGVKREINLREDLQVANKGQENLIHIMNHQVKGFFGIAKNIFAELLQSDDYGHMPDASKPLLEKGFETTNAGVSYVQDILRGASAEKGILPYDMKPINIKDVISPLLIEQKDIAIKKGLSFESNIEEGDYNMIGDAVQLKEALKNLITNAIRYNDYSIPNGGINIDLKRKGDKIIFSVKDTGVGIAEEDKPRLFTAGGRGKNSIKINVESSGYGLAFVKDVAEKHKGTVGYRPNKTGRGTTFFMELSAKTDGGMIISSAN